MNSIPDTRVSVKPHQLDLFRDQLPHRPYCTDSLDAGLVIRQKLDAISKRYIQANGPTHLYWLPFDVDRETASFDWQDRHCPAPNIVVTNPENGHAHLLYGLEVPVRKAPDAQLKPLRYAAAVEFGLLKKLEADYGYAGLIVKNPLHESWIVQCFQDAPYSLGWLADYIDLEKVDYRRKPQDYGLGRNCTVFNSLRLWAYRAIRENWPNYESWFEACRARAASYNSFPSPLPESEIRATAKSVSKWVYQRFSASGFSAVQSRRGKRGGVKSGEVRKVKAAEKTQLLLTFEGLPSSVVSSMTGIPLKTVYRLRAKAATEANQ
jgi:hypothetical protein